MNTLMVINNPPNIFKAEVVHRDLDDNRDLWEHIACIYQTVGIYGQADCEVQNICYYLLVTPGMEAQLINLVSRWKPGKAEWANIEESKRFDVLNSNYSLQRPKVLKVTWVV